MEEKTISDQKGCFKSLLRPDIEYSVAQERNIGFSDIIRKKNFLKTKNSFHLETVVLDIYCTDILESHHYLL